MGFFKKLLGLGPRNPTESFPRRLIPPQIVWDHGARTFCGIPLPSPVERLEPLGPCDGFRSLNEYFYILSYPTLGLDIEVGLGQIQHLTLHFGSLTGNNTKPGWTMARPVLEPSRLAVDSTTSPEMLATALGAGEVIHQDEEETVFIHHSGHVAVEAAYTPEGQLITLDLYKKDE